MNTLNAVSLISRHGITSNYSTDRGIIETSLKTSFSRSHFSLFSPILIGQIPAFPRKGKSPVEEVDKSYVPTYSSVGKAWRRRDQLALQECGVFPFSVSNRSVGFFPFQFRIVLAVLPLFKEQRLAIPLSLRLKLSFWGLNPRVFCHLAASVNQPPRKGDLVWFISFVSSET